MGRKDAFGVELDAVDGVGSMFHGHDHIGVCILRGDL